jgi:hypothetical protein
LSEATAFAIFCAFALSVTTMPASNDIDMHKAVSHRQPDRVRTLFPLVICSSTNSFDFVFNRSTPLVLAALPLTMFVPKPNLRFSACFC